MMRKYEINNKKLLGLNERFAPISENPVPKKERAKTEAAS